VTYARGASPLHAARAGVAAAWCLVLAGIALGAEHPLVLAALLAAVVAAGLLAGAGRALLRTLVFALPFALLIALVNPLVVREGLTVIWRFGEVPPFGQLDVTLEATVYGAVLGLRALVALLACVVLSAAVDPDELLHLFRRVSFRSALTAALAVRLVPVLARDARRLDEARRLRASGEPSRLVVGRAVAAGALDRAADVAAALEVRGYAGARPAPRRRRPWSRHDTAFTLSAVALVAAAVALRPWFTAYPELRIGAGATELGLAAALLVLALLPFADRRGVTS
jgi:energy-coupling factor transport system permease protein